MRARLTHRLKSQRGATLSMALMLMLVCVVVSGVVLAAATASAGRAAELGASDQRYYSVTSAVRLFEASLGEDRKVTYLATQSRDSNGNEDVVLTTDEAAPAYDFLGPITSQALFGVSDFVTRRSEVIGELGTLSSDAWIEPFSTWASDTSKEVHYTITMPISMASDPNDSNMAVVVNGRLHNDWTLELEFCNTGSADKHDVYKVYMLLQAEVSNEDHVSEYSDPQVRERETRVVWELVSVEQGRGLAS